MRDRWPRTHLCDSLDLTDYLFLDTCILWFYSIDILNILLHDLNGSVYSRPYDFLDILMGARLVTTTVLNPQSPPINSQSDCNHSTSYQFYQIVRLTTYSPAALGWISLAKHMSEFNINKRGPLAGEVEYCHLPEGIFSWK